MRGIPAQFAPAVLVVLACTFGCATPEVADEQATEAVGTDAILSSAEGPAGSAFWRVPLEAEPGAERGDILWVHEREDAPAGSSGWNIIYVSESTTGALVYVSGEIYIPNSPSGEPGERRLAVWNHGTAGTEDTCAPSRNTMSATDRSSPATYPGVVSLLERGYVVAMSDYQGLGTPGGTEYLNGPSQGMAALDVARAARNFEPASVGPQVTMYGFSQGGQTSLWAAHLAATYAPELELLGVIATAPAARQLDLSFYDLGIPANSGYFISRMAGLSVGHPEVRLRDILTPAGLEMLDFQTWDCYEIFPRAAQITEPYARPEALEPGTAWRTLLDANDAFLPIPSSIPVLIIQGDADVDVGVELTRDVSRDICAEGGVVEYQEYSAVNHMDMDVQAIPQVADWFDARFNGDAAANTCE